MVNSALVKADPFSLMDRLDDMQVVAEIKGAVLKEWVYSFPMGGKEVEGLSKAGVDACVSELAKKRGEVLREIDFQLIQEADAVIATVKAGRYAVSPDGKEILLETVFGVKRQLRKEEIYDKDADGNKLYDTDGKPIKHLIDDPFVIEKALMKAARNAKKRLLPMDVQQMIILQARQEGRVQRVKTENGESKQSQDQKYFCKEHKTKWFKSGNMRGYAHKIAGTDKWCNMPVEKAVPNLPEHERDIETPEGAGIKPSTAATKPVPATPAPTQEHPQGDDEPPDEDLFTEEPRQAPSTVKENLTVPPEALAISQDRVYALSRLLTKKGLLPGKPRNDFFKDYKITSLNELSPKRADNLEAWLNAQPDKEPEKGKI